MSFGADWSSAIASVVGSVGQFFGQRSANNANRNQAREANLASAASAREQMAFQERMSGSQYQRARADLVKAGYNPMLAYSQGGAGTPGGSSYSAITGAPQQNVLSGAAATALEAVRLREELRNLRETNAQIRSQTALNKQAARKVAAEANIASANTAKAVAHGKLWSTILNLTSAGEHSAKSYYSKMDHRSLGDLLFNNK